jgi:uncharacterized protein (TIGR02265 family)
MAKSRPSDVDVEAHLALLPPDGVIRGFLIAGTIAQAGKSADVHALAGLPDRRYLPFLNYPVRDYVRLLVASAALAHPRAARSDALRLLAWSSFDIIAGTTAGRAMFSMLGEDPTRVLLLAKRAYALSVNFGTVEAQEIAPRHVRVSFRDYPIFLESTQVGVMEGVVRHFNGKPQVTATLADLGTGFLDVRW